MTNNNENFKRTKLNYEDWKFVIYLFFHSIYSFLILKPNKAKFEWLTASGKFER